MLYMLYILFLTSVEVEAFIKAHVVFYIYTCGCSWGLSVAFGRFLSMTYFSIDPEVPVGQACYEKTFPFVKMEIFKWKLIGHTNFSLIFKE